MRIRLNECVQFLDEKRIPLSAKQRSNLRKAYPYYGAQGIIDYVDDYIFNGNYILVAEDGNNLKSLNMPIATWATGKFWVNNHAHILGEKDGYNLKYIYYLLNSLDLRGFVTGSAQPKLNQENLSNVYLNIPGKVTQNKVSIILSTLDSKIANNNKIAQHLESMTKTIYDYWFLQFEFPNEEGKPYKSSGGKMVWNEELQQEIPDGWSIGNMGGFIDVIRGVSYAPKDALEKPSQNSIPLLKSNNIQDNAINLDSLIYLDKSKIKENQYLDKGSVFITMSSGSKAHMGKTAIIYKGLRYTYGAFCAKIVINDNYSSMISMFFTSSYFRKYIERVTSGTSINNISIGQLQAIKIPVPPIELSQQFTKIVEPIYDKLGNIFEQNQKLQSLRDFLIPLLMNGQVTINEK